MSDDQQQPVGAPSSAENKVLVGILAIFFGTLGVHKFILGYKKEALIMLLTSVLTLFILSFIPWIIGIVEGIIYLTKSDEEYVNTYVKNKKGWF